MRTHAIFFRIVGYLLLGAISASTQEPTPDQPDDAGRATSFICAAIELARIRFSD